MSYYLKYRPRKVEELDLTAVREAFVSILKSGKLAHVYLLVGPRGSGKTSAARILAKVANCRKTENGLGEPCLECELCLGIEKGAVVDVMEIDAASHRGIDAIRELRDKVSLAPIQAQRKVYIIDEVHMLTSEAFNALLKTLEEPPDEVYFILCTTEEHKVPETIASRCVRVGFTKATEEEMRRSLDKAVTGEGLKIEEEAVMLLANSVDGSFREGHKLLEQLGKGKIGMDQVGAILGRAAGVEPEKLGGLLLKGETGAALEEIAKGEKQGVNWSALAEEIINYLRGELRAEYGLIDRPKKRDDRSINFDGERIRRVLEVVARAAVEMKTAVVEQLPLELAAVELGIKRSDLLMGKEDLPARTVPAGTGGAVSLDEVMSKWEGVIRTLAPQNHSVAGLLRSCRPKAIEDKFLIIEAFYKFHKEQLEQETRRRMVERALSQAVGVPAVRFVLGQKAKEVVPVDEGDDKLVAMVEEVFGVEAN